MSRKPLGVHAKIFMFAGKFLCLDPITQYGGDPTKWTVCTRGFKVRMTILLVFFGIFHCKVRVYDVLVAPTVSFPSYVLLGCSSIAMFFIINQMLLTYFTSKDYVKVVKVLRDIYVHQRYGLNLNIFNALTLSENCVLAVVVVQSFASSMVTSNSWHQKIAKAIMDTYIDVTLTLSCFLYFNTTYLIKRCFARLYERAKHISDAKCLKLLWKDYLKLHSTVEKVLQALILE